MDINNLRIFLTACETLSFTETAKRVYLSRQAVSQTIRKLEHELNTTLFFKNKNTLSLTPAGQKLQSEAAKLVMQYDRFENNMASYLQSTEQRLEIWVGAGVREELPQDIFTRFSAAHPEILLTVKSGTDADILARVKNADGKIGLIVTTEPMITEFDHQLIQRSVPYVLVNRSHPLSRKPSVTVDDLRELPIVGHGEGYEFHRNYVALCLQRGFTPKFSIISTDPQIAIQLVRENRSVSFALASCKQLIDPKEIAMIPFVSEMQDEWGIYSISDKSRPSSAAQQTFTEYLQTNISAPEKI